MRVLIPVIDSIINKNSINEKYIPFSNSMSNIEIPSLSHFLSFFSPLQAQQLSTGLIFLHSRIRTGFDPISFEQAQTIFLSICKKDLYKSRKNWKKDEVSLLIYIVDKASVIYQLDFVDFDQAIWANISKIMPGRTDDACKTKMLSLFPNNLTQTPWTQVEQQILSEIIEQQGIKWSIVSLKLFEKNPTKIYRTNKQCRERYMCFLKPDLKKGFWSAAEDYQMIELFLKYGRKWSKMAQVIKGRNENAIKNRFFLLFQQSVNNQKVYYSEFMRKVMRRKEKLEKLLLSHEDEATESYLKTPTDPEKKQEEKAETNHDELGVQCDFADIERFLTF